MKQLKGPLFIMIIGVFLGLPCLYFYNLQAAKRDWPTTNGEVLDAQVKVHEDYRYIQVEYKYKVAGETYSGKGRATDGNGDEIGSYYSAYEFGQEAEEWRESSPELKIYFNPENPSNSTTTTYTNTGLLIGAIFGLLLAGLGMMGVLTALYKIVTS